MIKYHPYGSSRVIGADKNNNPLDLANQADYSMMNNIISSLLW